MKKALRAAGEGSRASEELKGIAVRAALGLLERSVRMRHRRLAVQRLRDAVALGADVPDDVWCYCREAATATRDTEIQGMYMQSAQAAYGGRKRPLGEIIHG
jgi:hypothetical protein